MWCYCGCISFVRDTRLLTSEMMSGIASEIMYVLEHINTHIKRGGDKKM